MIDLFQIKQNLYAAAVVSFFSVIIWLFTGLRAVVNISYDQAPALFWTILAYPILAIACPIAAVLYYERGSKRLASFVVLLPLFLYLAIVIFYFLSSV